RAVGTRGPPAPRRPRVRWPRRPVVASGAPRLVPAGAPRSPPAVKPQSENAVGYRFWLIGTGDRKDLAPPGGRSSQLCIDPRPDFVALILSCWRSSAARMPKSKPDGSPGPRALAFISAGRQASVADAPIVHHR